MVKMVRVESSVPSVATIVEFANERTGERQGGKADHSTKSRDIEVFLHCPYSESLLSRRMLQDTHLCDLISRTVSNNAPDYSRLPLPLRWPSIVSPFLKLALEFRSCHRALKVL